MKLTPHFYNNLLIAKNGRYAYVMVPKSANTTIKTTLWNAEVVANGYPYPPPDRHPELHMHPEAPFTSAESKWEFPIQKHVHTFTVVRNPFLRALSGYRDKGHRLGDNLTFREFLQIVSEQDPSKINHHFAPQSIITAADQLKYDSIIYLESLDNQLAQLLAVLFNRPLPIINGYNSTNSKSFISEQIDEYCVELIRDYYAEDFSTFGYDTNLDNCLLPPVAVKNTTKKRVNTLLRNTKRKRTLRQFLNFLNPRKQ